MGDHLTIFTIDTDDIAPSHRLEFLLDGLKETVGDFDADLPEDVPMRQVFRVRDIASTSVASFYSSPAKVSRKADHSSEPAVCLNLMRSGGVLQHSQFGRESEVRPGDAIFSALYESFTCECRSAHVFDMVRLDRRRLRLRVPDLESVLSAPIERSAPAVRLLTAYIDALKQPGMMLSPELLIHASDHIHDLAAMALAPIGVPAASEATGAARKVSIQRYVLERLTDPGLDGAAVAARFGISDRYLRRLFESEGGFWAYVVGQRLTLAHKVLIDPTFREVKIIDIAYRCGFNSLSAFNRTFARAYGCSPSSVR